MSIGGIRVGMSVRAVNEEYPALKKLQMAQLPSPALADAYYGNQATSLSVAAFSGRVSGVMYERQTDLNPMRILEVPCRCIWRKNHCKTGVVLRMIMKARRLVWGVCLLVCAQVCVAHANTFESDRDMLGYVVMDSDMRVYFHTMVRIPGITGHVNKEIIKSDIHYGELLAHVGGLRAGEQKPVFSAPGGIFASKFTQAYPVPLSASHWRRISRLVSLFLTMKGCERPPLTSWRLSEREWRPFLSRIGAEDIVYVRIAPSVQETEMIQFRVKRRRGMDQDLLLTSFVDKNDRCLEAIVEEVGLQPLVSYPGEWEMNKIRGESSPMPFVRLDGR